MTGFFSKNRSTGVVFVENSGVSGPSVSGECGCFRKVVTDTTGFERVSVDLPIWQAKGGIMESWQVLNICKCRKCES